MSARQLGLENFKRLDTAKGLETVTSVEPSARGMTGEADTSYLPLTGALLDLLRRSNLSPTQSLRHAKVMAGISRPVYFKKGDVIYDYFESSEDLYVIVYGRVEHVIDPDLWWANRPEKVVLRGELFGWEALLGKHPCRLGKVTCLQDAQVLAISGMELMQYWEGEPDSWEEITGYFAEVIKTGYAVPERMLQFADLKVGH